MNETLCKNCQYYLQHYALNRRTLYEVYCGHCTFPRAKHRKPDMKACEHFLPGPGQEEAFVSKEYLSKELLRYMLSLDILPEIKKDEGFDLHFCPTGQKSM